MQNQASLNTENVLPQTNSKLKETLVELASVLTLFAVTSTIVLMTSLTWINL